LQATTATPAPLAGARGFAALALALAAAPPLAAGERLRQEMARTVVEYETGALSRAEAAEFAELVERGVADVESLVGRAAYGPAARRLRVVVSSRVPISRTYGQVVYLPLERVRTRSAPYLHEIVHALVPYRGDRTWLSEGLACYLESRVAETLGGYDAHVFTNAGNRGIDAAAREILAGRPGRRVLPWVGGEGDPPRLEDDRDGVARPFYVLSHSLAKHMVERAGLPAVLRILASSEPEAVLRVTGRSGEDWRRGWLRSLG
jgi:hypothetical protein